MKRLVVQKFGGTSVADIARIRRVARRALACQRAGNDVVVVVSAMSGETDRLLSMAEAVLPLPVPREQDALLATGEQVSIALTAMAIQAEGGQARSLLGHQVTVLTDSSFNRARILRIGDRAVRAALSRGEIPVVAGFQGVDAAGDITTLGRGGSDTTAVALAAALGADACEIYTDVDGVYTADPRICPDARKLARISHEEMLDLASLGAKVLQVRSVEIAMKHGIDIHVRTSFTEDEGTWVTSRGQDLEARALAGLSCARGQARVELTRVEHRPGILAAVLGILSELEVCIDMISHPEEAEEPGRGTIALTVPEADLRRAEPRLASLAAGAGAGKLRVTRGLAKISMVGIGIRSDPAIGARVCHTLARRGIAVASLAVGELRISVLVDEKSADTATRALHEEFWRAPADKVPPSRNEDSRRAARAAQ